MPASITAVPLGRTVLILTAAWSAAAAPAAAQETRAATAASEWTIEDPRAPTETVDFVATEGTWMSVDVAPDGRAIAFDLLGHIYELPAGGGEARALTSGRSWNMYPRYSPDGTRIAFTSDRGGSDDVWILERASGALTRVSKLDRPVFRASWSADGRHLFASVLDDSARSKAIRLNLHGTHQDLHQAGVFTPLTRYEDHPARNVVYFEHNDGNLPGSGARLKTYDKRTGRVSVYVDRPGGAFNPALSPDGRRLAYMHRDDRQTTLVIHELDGRRERMLPIRLDRDRQEYKAYHYGAYPGMAWHPNGRELVLAVGGRIRAVDVESGGVREVPFRARVQRRVNRTLRFPVDVPETDTRTRSHRWAQRTDAGILFEALGDIHLKTGDGVLNLTDSPEHETSPVYDPITRSIYYAAWSDDSLGAVYARPVAGGAATRLASGPAQYGALALSPDGRSLAFLRGRNNPGNGQRLERETSFDLVLLDADRAETRVTTVEWTPNFAAKLPPTPVFGPAGERLYFTEFSGDSLLLKRIRLDGADEETLYHFPHAVRAVISPDLRWIVFREYHRSHVTPFEFVGKVVTVSGHDKRGFTRRVDPDDGVYASWSGDGRTLYWTRGATFHEKPLERVLADSAGTTRTDLSFRVPVDAPTGVVAFTGVRVLTMNAGGDVLEDATVLIRGHRIETVGRDVPVPPDAQVYALPGHTLMPGIVDAHAHYGSDTSPLNVIEQRVPGLHAALAHGVTTMYELYGNAEKDFWVSDMVRTGRMAGPRLFSVGSPIYGLRGFRPRLFRSITSYEDALEHARYNRDLGATALKDYVNFTRAPRHQLATAARELRMNVVSETAGNHQMNLTQLLDGMTGLEHSMGLTPLYGDVIRLFQASGIGTTPTLLVVYNGPSGESHFHLTERVWENGKLLNFARKDDLLRLRRPTHFWPDDLYAPEMAAELKTLYDAGSGVQLGAHGQMLGLDAHWEMELFVQGGFPPIDAIRVATINGARYHGLDRQLGSIEPGKLADLVVLARNPLEDIRNTRSILYVMKHGVLFSGDDGARVHPEPRPAAGMYFAPEG